MADQAFEQPTINTRFESTIEAENQQKAAVEHVGNLKVAYEEIKAYVTKLEKDLTKAKAEGKKAVEKATVIIEAQTKANILKQFKQVKLDLTDSALTPIAVWNMAFKELEKICK